MRLLAAILAVFAVAGVAPPLPLVETYSIKTMETLLRTQARAIAIVPRAVATELASAGAAAILPHALSWDLPPVGAMWLRRAQQSEPLTALVQALQQAMQ